jgi:hypothetical protein
LLGVGQLPLEQLSRAAQATERILHLVSQLANDSARELLLRDESGFAPYFSIALGVVELEQQKALVLQGRRATVESDFALANSGRELTQAVCETSRQRAPAQRDELARRMHELLDGSPDDSALACAEETFRGGIQIRNRELLVEDDDRRREALQDVAWIRREARPAAARERRDRLA